MEFQMLKTRLNALLFAWFIAFGCIFTGLGAFPLIDPDEGRNAEIAREMKEAHSYLIPLYNGLPRLDKPALFFDTVALSFSLFGENEFAARLPNFSVFILLACL
jgi:4-amino-4-deoxy-L-arabinose transferase-like glycosyltransferase